MTGQGRRLFLRGGVKGLVLTGALFWAGCAKVSHLDQLLTLKDLSDEQERLARHVEDQDARFEALLRAVEDKSVGRYAQEREMLEKFGEPVYREEITLEDQQFNRWTYRYAMRFFDSPKVCLYWDPGGRLVRWEITGGGDHGTSR